MLAFLALIAVMVQPEPDQVPPEVRLGLRSEWVRRQAEVIPEVVIVPDETAFVEAIARWKPKARFPVLLDDGRWTTREDIARFIRAFEPRRVVRWDPDIGAAGNASDRRSRIDGALARSWGIGDGPIECRELCDGLRAIGVVPPGLVVADERASGRLAALALAAGHGQPIAWVPSQRTQSESLERDRVQVLHDAIVEACDSTGLTWRELGDELDALTLCLDVPVKVESGEESIALTDLLGRHMDIGDESQRYAWPGQMLGTMSRAATDAMCALFLVPERAMLFDGYPDEAPWNNWDVGPAAEVLQAIGLETVVFDAPNATEVTWRHMARHPLNTGMVFVNSKGGADVFHLLEGQGRSADAPFLQVPAIVHFVHSWSATRPLSRRTVAGRWIERGAYAYAGSVHEPFLQAFVPTATVARRLVLHAPWAAAIRIQSTRPWKIACLGDPLLTIGPAAPRTEAPLPFDATSLQEDLDAALGGEHFAQAVEILVLLGRDEECIRLVVGLLRERPQAVTAMLAEVAFGAAFRVRDRELALQLFEHMSAEDRVHPIRRDMLWAACSALLLEPDPRRAVDVLRPAIRRDVLARDAAEVARAVARVSGPDAGVRVLEDAKTGVRNQRTLRDLERAIRNLKP